MSFCPHRLDCCHHIGLLVGECLSQAGCPCQIASHVMQHARKLRQRFHAWVPWLFIHLIRELLLIRIRILGEPVVCIGNLLWISRCSENLSDQRVGIEGNGSHQSIQLGCRLRRNRSSRVRCRGLLRWSLFLPYHLPGPGKQQAEAGHGEKEIFRRFYCHLHCSTSSLFHETLASSDDMESAPDEAFEEAS